MDKEQGVDIHCSMISGGFFEHSTSVLHDMDRPSRSALTVRLNICTV